MFQINLVPEVQEEKQKVSKTNTTVITVSIFILIALGVTLLVIAGIVGANKIMISRTNNSITETKKEMTSYAELEKVVLSLENGLKEAKSILNGNSDWTLLLAHLEKATPNDIRFVNLQLEDNQMSASLEGKDINSLARFVSSYKNYQVVTVKGSGNPGDTVKIEAESNSYNVPVGLNGSYVYSVKVDLTKDQTIRVTSGENTTDIQYSAEKKTISSQGGTASASINNLFSNVSVSQYTKTDKIKFDAKMNFDGSLLWQ